jgi:regulator of protease activity HflC (stomatin/prohibitin superfamily)
MRFTIRDETVHAAFDTLDANTQPAAAARAMRERREDEAKAAKAKAFLQAAGSVAEREARAILSEEYYQARERYYAAVEADEEFRNERSKCEAIIEAWRTVQSNYRAMGKVAA